MLNGGLLWCSVCRWAVFVVVMLVDVVVLYRCGSWCLHCGVLKSTVLLCRSSSELHTSVMAEREEVKNGVHEVGAHSVFSSLVGKSVLEPEPRPCRGDFWALQASRRLGHFSRSIARTSCAAAGWRVMWKCQTTVTLPCVRTCRELERPASSKNGDPLQGTAIVGRSEGPPSL